MITTTLNNALDPALRSTASSFALYTSFEISQAGIYYLTELTPLSFEKNSHAKINVAYRTKAF